MSLVIMPCGDLEQYGPHEHEASSFNVHQDHSHDHDHHDEADTCSPFCVCACCGVVYNFEFTSVLLPEQAVQSGKKFPHYASHLYSNEFVFIWKPPKVG